MTGQRGDTFAARLVKAHADLAELAPGPAVRIGMNTPHVTPQLLAAVVAAPTDSGLRVSNTATLRDVDTVADAVAVANDAPDSRFAEHGKASLVRYGLRPVFLRTP